MTGQRSYSSRGYLAYYVAGVLIWGAEAALTKAFLTDALAAAPLLSLQNWFWLLWMGGISSGLAYVFYYKGLQGSNVINGSVVTLLGPVVGVTLSVLLLDESLSALQVVGIAGLLATVYLLSTSNLWSTPHLAARQQVNDDDQNPSQASTEAGDVARPRIQ